MQILRPISRMTESVKGIEVTEDSQKKELIVVVAQQQIEVGGTVLYLENEVGSYSVQLVCSNNNNSSEGTPATPQPTTTKPPHNVLYLVMGTVITAAILVLSVILIVWIAFW